MSKRIEIDGIDVEEGSGNVFADLGLPDPEERLAKADLSIAIARIIRDRGWTQTEAAEVLGVSQPDISHLFRGKLAGFSIERLTRFLNLLGQDVEITVRPAQEVDGPGRLLVTAP